MKKLEKNLTDIVGNENGNALIPLVIGAAAVASVAVGAYCGSYVGQWGGELWGNLVDMVPYVKNVAPWLAERCGGIGEGLSRHDLNVQLYKTTGAIAGFYGGLSLPWKTVDWIAGLFDN